MRPIRPMLALATAAMLLSTVPAAAQSAAPGASAPPGTTIEGIDWRLRQARLSGVFGDIPESVNATLRLEAGQASGNGGCNGFGGSYTLDGASLTFGEIVSTMMACSEPAMTIEGFYFADLAAVAGYTTNGTTLQLIDAEGGAVLNFEVATPDITAVEWQLRQVVIDGTLTDVPSEVIATLRFENGQVHGTSGCNTFSGSYTIDGTELHIGLLAMTEMACPEPRMSVEAAYQAALAAVAGLEAGGTSLRLLDAAGTVTLAFEAGPTTVAGSWIVTGIGDGEGAVSSLIPGSQLTAAFAADGTVSGSSGCNEYRGTYAVSGNTIAIDALLTTKRACIAGGLGDQEAAYIGALRSATSFTLKPGTLQLLAANGELLVSLSPVGLPD